MKIDYETGDKVIHNGKVRTVAHAYVGPGAEGTMQLRFEDQPASGRYTSAKRVVPDFSAEWISLVVREGETGDGDVIRVILMPDDEYNIDNVAALAAYGSQHVKAVEINTCLTADDVKRVFDEMNLPDADDVPRPGKHEFAVLDCDECGNDMALEAGVSHHLDPEGNVDHDRDADHVARNAEAAGG